MNRLLIVIALMILIQVAFAGDVARKGTAGAEQLLIPVGARSIATSGAFHSNTTGIEAIYYNPAGLAGDFGTEAMFSYMTYIADINISYLAIGTDFKELGSVALSIKSIDFGDIPITTVSNPDGTGATYAPAFNVFGITYAKDITDRVRAGANLKLIHEGIMSTSANGVAFDFGVQYKFLGNLWIGVSLKNLGGNMTYEGQDLQQRTDVPNTALRQEGTGIYTPVTEQFGLPSFFEISMAYALEIENSTLLIGSTFRNHNSYEDAVDFGAELKLLDFIFIRTGYNYLLENQRDNQFGLCYGGGINYSTEGIRLSLDYAFRSSKDFKGNNVLTLKLKF